MSQRDTIAAIATAHGNAGIGVIRLSGAHAKSIAEALCGLDLSARMARYAALKDSAHNVLDRAVLLYFQAPASFTGEDVVEIQAHGSWVVLQMIMRRCTELGARAARAGEFSERAFLNNKIDLAQAEAIADLIAASSEAAARAAMRSLEGEFSNKVQVLLTRLTEVRTHVEALIDFSDEDINPSHVQHLHAQQRALVTSVEDLLAQAKQGQRLRDGLYVVIVGAPNAGKSSLLNALAASERAIVTDIAGTTRDVLREVIDLHGLNVTLVDTAGLRESPDPIEAEGIRRARAEVTKADLVLLLQDATTAAVNSFALLQADLSVAPVLRVLNKVDLADAPLVEADVRLSLKTGTGLDELRAAIWRTAGMHGGGSFSARERHVEALQKVLVHLHGALAHHGLEHLEIAGEELRLAQNHLSEITGAFSADDLLGKIFSSFCIGK